MEILTTIIEFFNNGGHFMHPIALVLALAIAISIERFIFLSKALRDNRRFWARVWPLLNAGKMSEAEDLIANSKFAVAHIMSCGFEQVRIDSRRSDVEIATEDGLMALLPAIERRTHYLATFSNAATLLGLLGTVLGLIGAFGALGNADPVEKANLLSAGISEAMSCTAFGLMVAIPSLFAHAYLQSQAGELVDTLESACSRFVTVISRSKSLQH